MKQIFKYAVGNNRIIYLPGRIIIKRNNNNEINNKYKRTLSR